MTQEHPITPPPELVKQWEGTAYNAAPIPYTHHIARCAARWGANQELEACCEWIYKLMDRGLEWSMDLRASRRPKPPSLKERALKILEEEPEADDMAELIVFDTYQVNIIRLALEQLDD